MPGAFFANSTSRLFLHDGPYSAQLNHQDFHMTFFSLLNTLMPVFVLIAIFCLFKGMRHLNMSSRGGLGAAQAKTIGIVFFAVGGIVLALTGLPMLFS